MRVGRLFTIFFNFAIAAALQGGVGGEAPFSGDNAEIPLLDRDLSWVQYGDKFKTLVPLHFDAESSTCFRNGHRIEHDPRAFYPVDACCVYSRSKKVPAGSTVEVSSGPHPSRIQLPLTRNEVYGGLFGKTLKGYDTYVTAYNEIPLRDTSLYEIKCDTAPLREIHQVAPRHKDIDTSGLKAEITIWQMVKHLAGVMEYIPDPARKRSVVKENGTRHTPIETASEVVGNPEKEDCPDGNTPPSHTEPTGGVR